MHSKNHKMRFEQHFPAARAFFFSIDCIFEHNWLTGCLLWGSCALVFADSQKQADELAMAGLTSTLEAGFAYNFGMDGKAVINPDLEFGGTKLDQATMATKDPTTQVGRAIQQMLEQKFKH